MSISILRIYNQLFSTVTKKCSFLIFKLNSNIPQAFHSCHGSQLEWHEFERDEPGCMSQAIRQNRYSSNLACHSKETPLHAGTQLLGCASKSTCKKNWIGLQALTKINQSPQKPGLWALHKSCLAFKWIGFYRGKSWLQDQNIWTMKVPKCPLRVTRSKIQTAKSGV